MTTTAQVQDLIAEALTGATMAGNNVFSPRSLPTKTDMLPVLLVQTPAERKENAVGRNGPASFYTTGMFRIVGRLKGLAVTGDAGAMAMDAALGVWQRQIEVTLINAPTLPKTIVQQFLSVEVTTTVKSEGEYILGDLVMTFGLEYYQPAEDFAPQVYADLDVVGVFVDLANIFDPNGDYTGGTIDSLFPGRVTAAPRTAGPDGRAEGIVFIGVPTIADFEDPDNSQLLPGL